MTDVVRDAMLLYGVLFPLAIIAVIAWDAFHEARQRRRVRRIMDEYEARRK